MTVSGVVEVLIVDDDARVLAAISETLALEDDLLVVDVAIDAAAAELSAARHHPAVALVDVLLPQQDPGIELVRVLCAAGCAVVAMSVQSSSRAAALAAGAVAFVEKGGDIEVMLSALRSAGAGGTGDVGTISPPAVDPRDPIHPRPQDDAVPADAQATVHHRYVRVDGHRLFYREAGPVGAPVLVLLHGYPTSSYMFRDLIPRLAGRYRVIAPDMLGFGLSDAPPVEQFDYTFDAISVLTEHLLTQLGVSTFAMYVQDYGAPIGWRLALRRGDDVTAVVTQNGNGYDAGFVAGFWDGVWDYQLNPGPDTEAVIRQALTVEAIRWQYVTGVTDESVVSPDTWLHDHALVARPGNDAIQLALFRDYGTNPPLYPALHDYLRTSAVPVLAVWGRGDEIFGPDGARAFGRDAVDPEIHLLDGGHFLLESAGADVAEIILDFLGRRLNARPGHVTST